MSKLTEHRDSTTRARYLANFEAAFPSEEHFPDGGTVNVTGMSMRQYYKAAALTGLLASSYVSLDDFEAYSKCAGHHADAMLAEDEANEDANHA